MRCFIAAYFNLEDQKKIIDIKNTIKKEVNGKYVSDAQLHLTIDFLGEISDDQIQHVKKCLDTVELRETQLEIERLKTFKQRKKDTVILSVKHNDALIEYQKHILGLLFEQGISNIKRHFNLHITLARKTTINNEKLTHLNTLIEPFNVNVYYIALMKSTLGKTSATHEILYKKTIQSLKN